MQSRTRVVLVVAVAIVGLFGVFSAPGSASELTVTTTSGDVEGVIGPSGEEWRGIPVRGSARRGVALATPGAGHAVVGGA